MSEIIPLAASAAVLAAAVLAGRYYLGRCREAAELALQDAGRASRAAEAAHDDRKVASRAANSASADADECDGALKLVRSAVDRAKHSEDMAASYASDCRQSRSAARAQVGLDNGAGI